jgi:U32 family peptidase
MKSPEIPELLAPAGNLSCAITAFESGADAVYAGLDRFNAREGADNFSFEDLSRLAAYAKSRGKRYYVTLNTLLKESEFEEALLSVQQIQSLEPDAVIVQDLGLAAAIRELFPRIPTHASTQMGIHNRAGVEAAAALGISRVILERQLDIEEVEAIVKDSPLEIEVFIHGALCCSLSGMCLFSSWMGGWSGNRGRCKQPCRRRFHTLGEGEKDKESGFFFSTRDLFSLDLISRYRSMGIASLKIEGRLKKEEYVEQVVRAYRLMLDTPEGEESRSMGEAKLMLSRTYGRHWSHGFSTEADRASVVNHTSPGVSGLLVGEVLSGGATAFKARISRRIYRGDRLRIQDQSGGEASAFVLTSIRKNGKESVSARTGDVVSLSAPFEVAKGTKLFKVGESRKQRSGDLSALPLYQSGRGVELSVKLEAHELSVTVAGAPGVPPFTWKKPVETQTARNRPLDEGMLRELFSATRDHGYRLSSFVAEISGDFFIPPGTLKQLRREFWEAFCREAEAVSGKEEGQGKADSPDSPDSAGTIPEALAAWRGKLLEKLSMVTAEAKSVRNEKPFTLPFFVPETGMAALRKDIASALQQEIRYFRISSLFQLPLLQSLAEEMGIEVTSLFLTSSWPLPVSNSFAAMVLGTMGISRVQVWLELDREAEKSFTEACPLPLEYFPSGRVPLLVTRAHLAVSGPVVDSRGGRFYITTPGPHGLTLLFSGEEVATKSPPSDLLSGYGDPGKGSGTPSLFNRDREWK